MVRSSIQIVPISGFEFDTGCPGGLLVYPKSVQARAEIATKQVTTAPLLIFAN